MPKKLKFPIAKIRRDGVVAIWLTYTNWSIMRDGIVRKYLEERGYEGRAKARREARAKHPDCWIQNAQLKSWHFLDSTQPFGVNSTEVLELYRVGRSAHPGANELTVEKLISIGDKREADDYEHELKNIELLTPNWRAEQPKEAA